MALGTTNISTTLVGTTLQTSSRDVGTLCTHPAINKYSKWKPIRNSKVAGITATDLHDANYGLTIPAFTSLIDLFASYHTGSGHGADWGYAKPRGYVSEIIIEPYRIGDFRNYLHAANPITTNVAIDKTAFLSGTTADKTVTGTFMSAESTDYQIGFADLNMSYVYLGIAIFDNTNTLVDYEINPTAGAKTVGIDITGYTAGQYKGILFLSSSALAVTDIIGLDNVSVNYNNITISNVPIAISMTPIWVGTEQYKTVSVRMTFRNYAGSIDLTACRLALRYSDNEYTDTMESGEQSQVIGTLSIASGSTEITYTFTNVDSTLSWLVWWSNSGTYPKLLSGSIIQEQI